VIHVQHDLGKLVQAVAAALDGGEPVKAKELALSALGIQRDCAEAWVGLACAERALSDFQAAQEAAQEALRIQPDYPGAWNIMGEAFRLAGDAEEALKCQNRALLLDSTAAQIWCDRGCALLMLSRPATAVACFERALEIEPELLPAAAGRGIAVLLADDARRDLLLIALGVVDQHAEGPAAEAALRKYAGAFLDSPVFDAEFVRCFDCVVQNELHAGPTARARSLALMNLALAEVLNDSDLIDLCAQRLDQATAGTSS
jgi:tetratricopeptide (TPR) repeat protein